MAIKKNLLVELKDNLKSFVNDSKQIRIKVLQVAKSENESSLVARSIADQLEKRVAFRKAIRQTTQALQKKRGKRL
jgi:small subunit ribosomal protein S3